MRRVSSNHFIHATAFLLLTSLTALSQVPLVQSMSPVSDAPGSKSFTLTVYGAGFKSTAVVNWNGSPRLTEVLSGSQMIATINASDVAVGTTASITVTNSGTGGGTSNVTFFPVTVKQSSVGFSTPFSTQSIQASVVGDFNGDGKLDLAWADSKGILNTALGNGDGTFQPAVSSGITFAPQITGDFNNDGKIDLVGVNGDIAVALGNGDGTFTLKSSILTSEFPTAAAADFNQDGILDLYIPGGNCAGFSIYLGNGDGTFTAGGCYSPHIRFSGGVVVGDFNGDGKIDLAAVGYTINPEIYIYLGNGDGTLTFLDTAPYQSSYSNQLFAADMNHDGKLDLITSEIDILLGNGDGTFVGGGYSSYGGVIGGIGDFNGDGNLDVLSGGVPMVVLPGDGTGYFLPPIFYYGTVPQYGCLGPIGDFNSDGHLDAFCLTGSAEQVLLQSPLSVSPSPNFVFANQNVGTISAPQVATVTNVGWSALTINRVNITGTNAGSFTQTNTCGTSLAANATCTISVSFAPRKAGNLVATVILAYGGLGSPLTISLSGTGVTAVTATLTPPTLKYATQLVGTSSATQTATLTNTGNQDVAVSNIAISGAFTQTNNCPSTLGIAGTCQIKVTFSPAAKGNATGTLTVTDNATTSPQTVALSGAGTVMTLSPIGVNFGDQKVGTNSATAPVTLTNTGITAVSLALINFTGTNPGDFSQTNNCGKSLAAKASCTINVIFDPAATGARSASLSVSDNGGGSPQTISVSGTGT
jgi:FG-GAP-like repeat/Abnormal spindle-like microcephaly-assoc'd, ASPM-SPD-2-Hydin